VQNLLKFTGLGQSAAPLLKKIIKHGERLECRGIGMFLKGKKKECVSFACRYKNSVTETEEMKGVRLCICNSKHNINLPD
jgi:hypothetical protein